MAGLFEQHDRSRFETFAFSYGPLADSPYRNRLRAAFAHWHDINTLSDAEAAALIRQQQIDVLVELKGITYGSRLGILNHGPAPVTLHYIGYPGTLAHPGIDYLVTDPIVSPPGSEADYAEPLCDCRSAIRSMTTAANARRQLRAVRSGYPTTLSCCATSTRHRSGRRNGSTSGCRRCRAIRPVCSGCLIPVTTPAPCLMRRSPRRASATVWANHGSHRKIICNVWVPQIWRSTNIPMVHIRPVPTHFGLALPMLTCLGSNYAGRVGASLLSAVGLDELITDSPEAYASEARKLLDDRALLRSYRDRLANPATSLFDTAGFTRAWEDLLMATHARARTAPNPESASLARSDIVNANDIPATVREHPEGHPPDLAGRSGTAARALDEFVAAKSIRTGVPALDRGQPAATAGAGSIRRHASSGWQGRHPAL